MKPLEPPSSVLRLEILTTLEETLNIKQPWSDLLNQSHSGNVFVGWEWVTTWWEHFGEGDELYMILIKDREEVVGIAPFMIYTDSRKGISSRSLSLIGQSGSKLCPDHLDIIAKPGLERAVADRVIEAILAGNKRWDKVFFSGVAEDSVFLMQLRGALSRARVRFYSDASSIVPYAELPFPKNEKKWRYYQRRLSKDCHVRLEHLTEKDDIDRGLEIVKKIVLSSAERKGRESDWSDSNHLEFHRQLANKLAGGKNFSIAILYCDETPASVLYGFNDKGKYLLYSTGLQSTFASYSVGQVLLGMFSQLLVDRKLAEEFDFLRGEDAYKYQWTERDRKDQFVYFYGKTFRGKLIDLIEFAYRYYQKWFHHES